MKPLLKWAGGKRHISSTLEQHLPPEWGKGAYFEPFLGGAAFFLHLRPTRAHLADINPWLIRFYKDVQATPKELFAEVSKYARKFDSQDEESRLSYYLQMREEFNSIKESLDSSALFYGLNKLCFNGLYRENSKGKFNVPFGQKKSFPALVEDEFIRVSSALSGATIELSDFEQTVSSAVKGDFVYFDPPYVPVNLTANFTSYSAGGFGLDSQEKLAATMLDLKKRGVKAMLSNSATPVTEKIFSSLRHVVISAPRMVSAKASGRGQIDELLIMNYS